MRVFKLIWTFATCLFIIFYISCRKIDVPKNDTNQFFTDKFFNTYRTSDKAEEALVTYIKNQNKEKKFVSKVIKQIGYPRWDKLIKKPNLGKGKVSTDTLDYYYIPFVRDSQSFVNASMVISASPTDTAFSYKCDWQYSVISNSTTSFEDSAEHYAIFFMQLDRHVFGYTEFNITDSNLFKSGAHKASKVRFVNLGNKTSKNNLLYPVEYCADIQILYPYTNCPWKNTYPITSRPPACMYSCDGCAAFCSFTGSVVINSCWTEWIDDGGSGGSTGGGTGGSTGGGSGGGSYPPECEEGLAYKNTIEEGGNCTPGWSADPTNPDDGYDYCAYINSVVATPQFQQRLNTLRSETSQNREMGYFLKDPLDPSPNYGSPLYGPLGDLSIEINLPFPMDGVMHNHFVAPNSLSIFSTSDLEKLAEYFKNGQVINPKKFLYTVVTNNTAYILMISNPAKFTAFLTKHLFNEDGTVNVGKKATFELIFETTYGNGNPTCTILEQEINFLKAVNGTVDDIAFDMGLKLFKGNSDLTQFTPIGLNRAGSPYQNGCSR